MRNHFPGYGPSCLAVLVLMASAGCATTSDLPPGPGESEARVFPASGTPRARTGAPADARLPARRIDGGAGLVALCDALGDEGSATFSGNEVEQARARERHRSHRIEAVSSRYQIDIGTDGYRFGDYDLSEKRVVVANRSFVVGGGSEIYAADNVTLAFPLGAEAAERALKLHDEGTLTLRLVFRPAPSDMRNELCLRLGGGIAKLAAEIQAAYLVGVNGATLAVFETQEFAQVMSSVSPVAQPAVAIDAVMGDDGAEVPAAVSAGARALEPDLLTCYRETLAARPNVRGKVVVRADLTKDGVLSGARMEVSSVGDEALVACTIKRVNGARLAATPKPRAVFVPINFGSGTE